MKANNLSQFKRLATPGTRIKGVVHHYHRPEHSDIFIIRETTSLPESVITKTTSTAIAIDRDGRDSWLNWPKASETSVQDGQLTIFMSTPAGQRVPYLVYNLISE